ncbi:MAG: hypothetical protein Q9188_005475 [Gyalolechia gomerana]
MGCFDRLEPLKRRIGRWRPSWTRSRPPPRAREIVRADSPMQELPSDHDLSAYRQTSRAGQASPTELHRSGWNESMAELPYRGPPTPDIISSTTHLVKAPEARE